ncbi:transcriptional regulator NrdR [Synechocystis salina LEGE 06099]|uniref:transcriptional regulator NrdR n=1 Tax=Synechocystis salina TaxID=945780 RepID=UPI00188197EF|nr:transcriptional regulator NrdR [Synechocystis salina]MBE9202922.1 transcriptional regulator NrdR [Synechocystis salina LEGE 06099]
MQCPHCQHHNSRVLESRSSEGGQSIRRRRECLECKHRFTTYERLELLPVTVIKQDGERQAFDRSKLLQGMVRACEKTDINFQRLEHIVEEIEANLQQQPKREIHSEAIGQMVLQYLRQESEVAYIRFASVYGRFQGIADFVDTLEQLQREQHPEPQYLTMS